MFRLAINIGDPYDNNILIKVTQHNNRKQKAQQNNVLKWRTNSRQNNSQVRLKIIRVSRRKGRCEGWTKEGVPVTPRPTGATFKSII